VQPHQFNGNTHQFRKRLNRCYQFNGNTHQFRKRLNRCYQFHGNTHQFRKRLNRCYQFNATVLVLFLFVGPIILLEKKILMNPFFSPTQVDLSIQVEDVEIMAIINS